jgi:hypothetical protein
VRTGKDRVLGSCEHGNEHMGSVKQEISWLNDFWLKTLPHSLYFSFSPIIFAEKLYMNLFTIIWATLSFPSTLYRNYIL